MVLDDPFCVRPVNTTSILHTTNSASPFGHHSHGRHFGRGTSNSRRSSAVASRYLVGTVICCVCFLGLMMGMKGPGIQSKQPRPDRY